jgi:hypothetical protein
MLGAFMVDGMPDPTLFRSTVGDMIERLCAGRIPCPMRAYGEMVDLLWQEGNSDGAIKLEILWNQLASPYDFALLCGYVFGHFHKRDPRSPISGRDRAAFGDHTVQHVSRRTRRPMSGRGIANPANGRRTRRNHQISDNGPACRLILSASCMASPRTSDTPFGA